MNELIKENRKGTWILLSIDRKIWIIDFIKVCPIKNEAFQVFKNYMRGEIEVIINTEK